MRSSHVAHVIGFPCIWPCRRVGHLKEISHVNTCEHIPPSGSSDAHRFPTGSGDSASLTHLINWPVHLSHWTVRTFIRCPFPCPWQSVQYFGDCPPAGAVSRALRFASRMGR
jgi:hypothetical protein